MFSLLDDFFNYKLVYDSDEYFYSLIKKINYNVDMGLIIKAYDFAKNAHEGQKRISGEPYISHPVKALEFLLYLKPDTTSIVTCLLHDVIEDTKFTYDDIKREFGEEIAGLCVGLEKVSKIKYHNIPKEEAERMRQLETLKKTFLVMGKDLRVIFIKLADRIHNIQTLDFHPKEEKKRRIALETINIYVPIAQRLGLHFFQYFLENGCFKILYPNEFNNIYTYLKEKFKEDYIRIGIEKISDILKKYNIDYIDIKGRIKSPYRIFKKLEKYKTNSIDKIMDILAFRVILNDIPSCYTLLGYIHSEYTPIVSKIKDYIAVPKSNGYKSLHTTILGMFDFPVEIQIRTKEMDDNAEYGVAAHYAYKEFGESVKVSYEQSIWIRKLQEIVKNYQDINEFKENLEIEILEKEIFVYTPKGDIIKLPKGSTVLDFAFSIHTDIGLHFKNAFVNGKIVPIDYKLNTGDLVEIEIYKNKITANYNWLNFLYTPSAKYKLKKYLKQKEKDILIEKSIQSINAVLKKLNLPILYSKDDKITKTFSKEDFISFLLNYNKDTSILYKTLKNLYSDVFKDDKKAQIKKDLSLKKEVLIDGNFNLTYDFCKECKPDVGDKIIAKTGRDGIKIHKVGCKSLEKISFDKLIEAHWIHEDNNIYDILLDLYIADKPGILLKILNVIFEYNINIKNIKTEDYNQEYKRVYITIESHIPSKISFLINDLKNNENLIKLNKVLLIN